MNKTIKIALSLLVGLTAALALACGAPDEMSKAKSIVAKPMRPTPRHRRPLRM
jgi:hypothetical protein